MLQTTTIRSLLEIKGKDVHWLSPDDSVYQAIESMASKGVGALLVLQEGRLIGIVSERDYARKVILKGRHSKDTLIREIMTSPVTYVSPACTIDEAMDIMTHQRIRHLPVVEDERVIGVLSIGDLVKHIIDDQAATIGHLHAYITGQYPR
jgi:CBS domain-containing protein